LMIKFTLGSNHELLVRVVGILVIVIFVVTGSDRDSLGPPPGSPLITLDATLCSLVGSCG
jgi:hypothetical protein